MSHIPPKHARVIQLSKDCRGRGGDVEGRERERDVEGIERERGMWKGERDEKGGEGLLS